MANLVLIQTDSRYSTKAIEALRAAKAELGVKKIGDTASLYPLFTLLDEMINRKPFKVLSKFSSPLDENVDPYEYREPVWLAIDNVLKSYTLPDSERRIRAAWLQDTLVLCEKYVKAKKIIEEFLPKLVKLEIGIDAESFKNSFLRDSKMYKSIMDSRTIVLSIILILLKDIRRIEYEIKGI